MSAIFLVDDTPAHRSLIRRALKKGGIEGQIIEADSLATARAVLSDTPQLTLAILDLKLTDGEGTELLGMLRERYPQLPILMLTTSALDSDRTRCLQAGASDFLTKSSDLDALSASLSRCLRTLGNS